MRPQPSRMICLEFACSIPMALWKEFPAWMPLMQAFVLS
jgi:hypothetical protein